MTFLVNLLFKILMGTEYHLVDNFILNIRDLIINKELC